MNKLPLLLLSIIAIHSGSNGQQSDVVDGGSGSDALDVVDNVFDNDTIDYTIGGGGREDDLIDGAVPARDDSGSVGLSNSTIVNDEHYRPSNPLDEATTVENYGDDSDSSSSSLTSSTVATNSEESNTTPVEPLEEDATAVENNGVDNGQSNIGSESLDEEVPDEATPGGNSETESKQISVPIAPPIALSFYCAEKGSTKIYPCDVAYEAELQLIELAAEEYIHENKMMELAMEFDVAKEEGVEYEGVDLTTSLPQLRRRHRRLAEEKGQVDSKKYIEEKATTGVANLRGNIKRRIAVPNSGINVILLSGKVSFNAPSNVAAEDTAIPGESQLSELLLTFFAENEAEFVDKIQSMASDDSEDISGDSWLTKVVGYKTTFENDLVIDSGGSASQGDEDVSDTSDTTNSQGGGNVIAGVNNSINNDTSSGFSISNNILLIVGAAGAAFSLVLLIGGLCYARKSYNNNNNGGSDNNSKKKKKTSALSPNNENGVIFQPGKNNPRSPNATSSNFFMTKLSKSGSGDALSSPTAPPPLPSTDGETNRNDNDDDDDDESHADFLLARAALDHSPSNNATGDEGSAADNTLGDDMSFAFTDDGKSLAPNGGDKSNTSGSNTNGNEDAMIGAGGLASFANDKGVFRWNDEGTKMVYTPKLIEKSESDSSEHNGFIFDEHKKKWVVKEQVVGEKNVSFKHTPTKGGTNGRGTPSLMRSRSNDSVGTGISGLSGFTYDDIALDTAKRSRSAGTDITGDSGTNASFGMSSDRTMNIPPSPKTPIDEGVEVPLDTATTGIPSSRSFDSEFAPNTNVDRFMMGGDDDSTAFSGFTDFANNAFSNNNASSNMPPPMPPPPPPPPRPVTPERVSSHLSQETDAATFATGDPGRIVPKKRSTGKPNKMKIAEDAPFDEDIPFDERPARSRSAGKSSQKKTMSGLILPNILDDLDDNEDVHSETSEESNNSAQVLEDLDKLSRFMTERKHSSKSSQSSASGPSRRRRKGGDISGSMSGSGGGSKRLGRKSSFGNNNRSSKYSDPSRGL